MPLVVAILLIVGTGIGSFAAGTVFGGRWREEALYRQLRETIREQTGEIYEDGKRAGRAELARERGELDYPIETAAFQEAHMAMLARQQETATDEDHER